jgi:hypothetical protein
VLDRLIAARTIPPIIAVYCTFGHSAHTIELRAVGVLDLQNPRWRTVAMQVPSCEDPSVADARQLLCVHPIRRYKGDSTRFMVMAASGVERTLFTPGTRQYLAGGRRTSDGK